MPYPHSSEKWCNWTLVGFSKSFGLMQWGTLRSVSFFTLDVHSTHFLDVVCGIFSSHPYFCFHSSWSMVFTGSVSGTRNPSGSYTEFTTDTLWVCGLSFTMILNMNVSFSTPHCRPWLCLPPEKQRAQRGCYSPTLWGEILPCDRQLTGLTSYTASCSEGIDFRQSST